MKSKIKYLVAWVLILGIAFSFFGCEFSSEHTHNWSNWETTTAPLCTKAGEETRICKDNPAHNEKQSIKALGHDLLWMSDDALHSVPYGVCQREGCEYVEFFNSNNFDNLFDPDVQSDSVQNGAYFLTRAGWESYVRGYMGSEDYNEEQIQREIDYQLEYNKDAFALVIYDNILSLRNSVYNFSLGGKYYIGQRLSNPLLFSLDGNILNMRLSLGNSVYSNREFDLQFERDDSILFVDEEPEQISTSKDFANNSTSLNWRSAQTHGILDVRVELRLAGKQNFEIIEKISSFNYYFYPLPNEYRFSIYWSDLDCLTKGVNVLRITLLGGPHLYKDKIYLTTNSEIATHEIVVTQLIENTLSAPTNFILGSHWLEWTSDDYAEWNEIYVNHNGGDFEEVNWDGGDGCVIIPPHNDTSIASLNLAVGENIVRVISRGYPKATFENGILTISNSPPGEFTITVTDMAEERVVVNAATDVSFNGSWIYASGRCEVYLKHPNEEEFVKVDGYHDHGSFVGTLPKLRLGESTLKVIRRGIRARLDGTTLVVYTDSEPVFIPIVINKIETIPVSAPTNVRITGSGTDAKLHWDCEDSDNWAGSVAIKHPGEDDFNCSAQAFYNSTQLNWLDLALGDNEIKLTSQGKGNILEGNTYKIYEPGITIYTITVHHEQKVSTPSNFRIEMIHDNLSLTWDRDPITNGNSISNNYTRIEVKHFGEEDFKDAETDGVLSSIGLGGNWLSVGENIVRVAIATGNVSIVNGVVTRYTPSDWGYVVLVKDANGNITIKE